MSGAEAADGLTIGELEDARLGFFHLLRRRFGREFKERHGDDLFAQAAYEFSRKLEQGEDIRNPAAWITRCAWNRAKTEMESRAWRPQLVPTESLPVEPVAESSWQPEESFLAEDRMRRVHEAVDQLPAYQREVIERHYFEEESVREIARKLGWSEGKGARAHNAARKKLRRVFGDPESWSPRLRLELGLAAFFSLSAAGRAAAAGVPAGLDAAVERAGHAVTDGWRKALHFIRHPFGGSRATHLSSADPTSPPGRVSHLTRRIITSPLAETAAAAGDGPGRAVEVCKVLAVCAISGTAAVGGIVGVADGHHRSAAASAARPASRHTERERPNTEVSRAKGAPPKEAVVKAPASDATKEPTGGGGRSDAESHGISESKTARTNSEEGTVTREAAVDGEESAREAFGAFGGRGEAESSEPSSSSEANVAGADVESLSDANTSTTTAGRGSPPSSSSSKESAEKHAAGEQFGGALR